MAALTPEEIERLLRNIELLLRKVELSIPCFGFFPGGVPRLMLNVNINLSIPCFGFI